MRASTPRRGVALAIALTLASAALPIRAQDALGETGIRGAGSTFVHPVLSRWSREYRAWLAHGGDFPTANGGLDDPPASSALEYEAVGSLAGTMRLKDRAVDFAASDMPLGAAELAQLGLAQFPLVIGGVVVAINIDGVSGAQLKLSGTALSDIFLGKITRWRDPALAALNPGLALPDAPITVIHRADGSGTTFNVTDYFSKVSPEWASRVGSGLLVRWPAGVAARGNDGVAQAVKTTRNSIGYVEHAQALRTGLAHALLQNRAGRFVRPDTASFQAAAANADWARARDFQLLLIDGAGENAYPITATVFILMPVSGPRARTRAALELFRWSLDKGAHHAATLGYVPLPSGVVEQVKAYWSRKLPTT